MFLPSLVNSRTSTVPVPSMRATRCTAVSTPDAGSLSQTVYLLDSTVAKSQTDYLPLVLFPAPSLHPQKLFSVHVYRPFQRPLLHLGTPRSLLLHPRPPLRLCTLYPVYFPGLRGGQGPAWPCTHSSSQGEVGQGAAYPCARGVPEVSQSHCWRRPSQGLRRHWGPSIKPPEASCWWCQPPQGPFHHRGSANYYMAFAIWAPWLAQCPF